MGHRQRVPANGVCYTLQGIFIPPQALRAARRSFQGVMLTALAVVSNTAAGVDEAVPLPASQLIGYTHGQYRLTFDSLALPDQEQLGLLGGAYLFDLPVGYLGLGVYGAVLGRRGGFFTGGFELGHGWHLAESWVFDAGFFVGGGGGGGAPQGGGLMLRPHLGLGRQIGSNRLGLGVSRVSFPNGGIASNQISLQWDRDFSSLLAMGWEAEPANEYRVHQRRLPGPVNVARRSMALHALRYFPTAGQTARGGTRHDQPFDVLGVRWRQQLDESWSSLFSTAGALGGRADGYAEIFAGLGYSFDCFWMVDCLIGTQLGAAGGGDVHTGGGVVLRASSGLSYRNRPWLLGLDLAYAYAPDGSFRAPAFAASLGYSYDTLLPEVLGGSPGAGWYDLEWVNYRIRAAAKRYATPVAGSRKQADRDGEAVDLVALKLDAFWDRHFFLTGQAEGAYSGGAGGYATGLVGLGGRYPLPGFAAQVGAELLFGAAGGGGISVGGGVIAQPMVNFAVDLDSRLGFELGLGYVAARGTQLRSGVIDVAVVYRLQAPRVKRYGP